MNPPFFSFRTNHRIEADIDAYKAFAARQKRGKDEALKKNTALREEVKKMAAELREFRSSMAKKVIRPRHFNANVYRAMV